MSFKEKCTLIGCDNCYNIIRFTIKYSIGTVFGAYFVNKMDT